MLWKFAGYRLRSWRADNTARQCGSSRRQCGRLLKLTEPAAGVSVSDDACTTTRQFAHQCSPLLTLSGQKWATQVDGALTLTVVVGVCGLGCGFMGSALALAFRRAGLDVIAWNRTPEKGFDSSGARALGISSQVLTSTASVSNG
ncbi:NAD(P)-binding domain-containing protein [Rhodococcus sp. JS3073]|uniref:NAD(P)-binding domain-containing protein n=1 Tax=Rhodococcus sp. JS3073 TaxID=3002901 RepID=UPI002285A694|nr:NAD(P)-binding domain-containing protein [Rhodococcus sp. JS3073]WAM20071.1 NAD(P)-binding domain-containing protein [Rhodococcus sp. JS3073]